MSHHRGAPVVAQRGETFHQDLVGAQSGDAAALERFARVARAELMRSLGTRLRGGWTESWIEDVVQEAMVDVCAHLQDCRASSSSEVLGWLLAIGRREAANLFRVEGPLRNSVSLGASCQVADFEEPDPPSPFLRLLRRRLSHLGSDAHEVLWLRLGVNATWTEVAREIGTTPSAAKRRFQRIIARLRRWRPERLPTDSTRRAAPPSKAHASVLMKGRAHRPLLLAKTKLSSAGAPTSA